LWAFPIHRYPAEMAGDMEPEPLCSIGVSSWSARGAEAAFDMIVSVTPAVTTGGGPYREPLARALVRSAVPLSRPEPMTLATMGRARAEPS